MEPTPFSTIESADEFLELLQVEIDRTFVEIETLLTGDENDQPRRVEALRLVQFKLKKLSQHTLASQRLLNDLKTLRSLLLR